MDTMNWLHQQGLVGDEILIEAKDDHAKYLRGEMTEKEFYSNRGVVIDDRPGPVRPKHSRAVRRKKRKAQRAARRAQRA